MLIIGGICVLILPTNIFTDEYSQVIWLLVDVSVLIIAVFISITFGDSITKDQTPTPPPPRPPPGPHEYL